MMIISLQRLSIIVPYFIAFIMAGGMTFLLLHDDDDDYFLPTVDAFIFHHHRTKTTATRLTMLLQSPQPQPQRRYYNDNDNVDIFSLKEKITFRGGIGNRSHSHSHSSSSSLKSSSTEAVVDISTIKNDAEYNDDDENDDEKWGRPTITTTTASSSSSSSSPSLLSSSSSLLSREGDNEHQYNKEEDFAEYDEEEEEEDFVELYDDGTTDDDDDRLVEEISSSSSSSSRSRSIIEDDGRHDDIVDRVINHFSKSKSRSNSNDGSSRSRNGNSNNNNNNNNNNIFEEEEDVVEKNHHRRGNVQLPPGWGKTQLSLMVLSRMLQIMEPPPPPPPQTAATTKSKSKTKSKTTTRIVMFVTPNLILVDQFLKDFDNYPLLSNIIIPHDNRLIVASKSNRTNEICTTSSDTISNFLLSNSDSDSSTTSQSDNNIKLLVCTYASLKRVGEAISLSSKISNSNVVIEFGIFDEAHTMEGIGKQTGYGLDDSNIPISYRFFLTATPRNYIKNPKRIAIFATKQRLDGGRKIIPTSSSSLQLVNNNNNESSSLEQQPVRSFLNQNLFGPCIVRKTQQQSVEQNATVPIKLIVMDKEEIEYILQQSLLENNYNNNNNHGIVLDGTNNNYIKYDSLVPFAVEATFHKYNVSHAVSFHSNNYRASTFMEMYSNVFCDGDDNNNNNNDKISVLNVNGKMSSSQREQILNDARNLPKSIITNCKVLATGVDEPHWNLVVMADPVESHISSRQIIGRVSRKAPGKEYGYVLIPMPMMDDAFNNNNDYDDNDKTFIMNDSYQNFFYSFEAMVGEDPELQQDVLFVINKMSILKRELKGEEFPSRILESFVTPSNWSIEKKSFMMNRAINEYMNQNSWDKMYELLLVYNNREYHCNVPQSHKEDGENLGMWLTTQRENKRKGKLDAETEKRLEEIGVVLDLSSQKWENMFTLLEQYKEREGNCNVSHSHKEDGENLGRWLNTQRMGKKKGILDIEKEKQLNAIGVVWDLVSQQWEDMFNLLEQYNEREGNCNVPYMHKEYGENLGNWLNTQRIKKNKGKLNAEKEQQLEEIGVVWDVFSHQWEDMFRLLVQYNEREGNCNVHGRHKEYGENLGNWLNRQRIKKNKGKLDAEKEQQLEEIGVVWDVFSHQWEDMFRLLVQYKEREGNCNTPRSHKEDGENLGNWWSHQRANKKKGKLDNERIRRFEEIGIVWSIKN